MSQDAWVGNANRTKRGVFTQSCPMNNSVVEEWDDMERIWEHTFYNELSISPDESGAVLLTQPCQNPSEVLERTAEIMFEQFAVPNLYMPVGAVLSLYTAGRFTGLSIECGHGSSSLVPVFNGNGLSLSSIRLPLGGQHVTHRLLNMLNKKGHVLAHGWQDAEIIKHQACRTALDFTTEMQTLKTDVTASQVFELSDGQSIALDSEQISPIEIMFQPSLDDTTTSCEGVPQSVSTCLNRCAKQLQKGLMANIIVAGGTTTMPQFMNRMASEIAHLLPGEFTQVPQMKPDQRQFSVWIGGSILGNLSTFERLWVSATEYAEDSSAAIHRLGL